MGARGSVLLCEGGGEATALYSVCNVAISAVMLVFLVIWKRYRVIRRLCPESKWLPLITSYGVDSCPWSLVDAGKGSEY